MKKITLCALTLVFVLSNATAIDHFSKGHYVSVSHLHNIFEQVKRTTNVSQKALADAFAYYEKNCYKKRLSSDYLGIADYTQLSLKKRLYIINLHSGEVTQHLVAHGKNSGKRFGRVVSSGDGIGSLKTPSGFFKIGDREGITIKKRYRYLSVDGLEGHNGNARKREILLHTASYVAKGGRSFGCFAIEPKDKYEIFAKLKTALLYSYVGV